MLDDSNVLNQRDPQGALAVAAAEWQQATYEAVIMQGEFAEQPITRVVLAGMGGSSLAALLVQSWLRDTLTIPFEVVREYSLPQYVDTATLVIASSCSGNTEETLSCLEDASARGAQLAVLTSAGELLERAKARDIVYVLLPDRSQVEPRMTTIAQMRALTRLLAHFGVLDGTYYEQIAATGAWLEQETIGWLSSSTVDTNYAKQLALLAVGKTAMFYGGPLTAPLAYKWKISWNENAKNVAFWNAYPEFNHNEFMGWTSHPVEKPFAVFDLVSSFEHPQVLKRFTVSDRLLSGKRPKATEISLAGDTLIAQLLWGVVLADFVSIYVAVLNGVNPTPVELIEKLKKELN